MKRHLRALLAIGMTLPAPAWALADDAAYCAALSGLASRYLVSGTALGNGSPDLETRTAIEDCRKGNTAAGIAVLERKLRANGFTLPRRS